MNNQMWTPEQMKIINQIKMDAAKELAAAEAKWFKALNEALQDAEKRHQEELAEFQRSVVADITRAISEVR